MDIRIKTTDYQITPDVSEYLHQKLASLEKLLGDDTEHARCEVELGRAGGAQRHGEYVWFAEIQVLRPGSPRVVARNQEPTMNAAIDNAKEEAMMQLRKEKKGNVRFLRKTGAAIKKWMRLGE